MAWALAATATSREEEGNYDHSFLQLLLNINFLFHLRGGSLALGSILICEYSVNGGC